MSAKKPAARVKEKTSHTTEKAAAARKRPHENNDASKEAKPIMDARSNKDRREGDRREGSAPVALERRGGERRAKVSRRRQIDPTTCERDYSVEEVEFIERTGRVQAPQWPHVPHVQRGIGSHSRTWLRKTRRDGYHRASRRNGAGGRDYDGSGSLRQKLPSRGSPPSPPSRSGGCPFLRAWVPPLGGIGGKNLLKPELQRESLLRD